MSVEVKQLVVKGTILGERSEPVEESEEDRSEPVDERVLLSECRRMWAEEQRQRRER